MWCSICERITDAGCEKCKYFRDRRGVIKATIEAKCDMCGKVHTIKTTYEDIKAYQDGALVQDVFPYLSPGERELIISGTCGECFDNLFKEV